MRAEGWSPWKEKWGVEKILRFLLMTKENRALTRIEVALVVIEGQCEEEAEGEVVIVRIAIGVVMV